LRKALACKHNESRVTY
jgi:AFG3 family protein